MCVIIITPGTLNSRVAEEFEEILRHSDRINPHGGGVINRNTGEVTLWEAHKTRQMKEYILENIDDPLAIHYRKSTSGSSTGTDNLHPFQIGETDWWLMMNGTHPGLGYGEVSDTRELAHDLLASAEEGVAWASMMRMINPARGALVNSTTGVYHLYNRGTEERRKSKGEGWFKRHGIWYSKSNVFPENNKVTHTNTATTSTGYQHSHYAHNKTNTSNTTTTGGSTTGTPGKPTANGSVSNQMALSQGKTDQSGSTQSTKDVTWGKVKSEGVTTSVFSSLRRAGCSPAKYPTLAACIAEECVLHMQDNLRDMMISYIGIESEDLPHGITNARLLRTCLELGWEFDLDSQRDRAVDADMFSEANDLAIEMGDTHIKPLDIFAPRQHMSSGRSTISIPKDNFHPYGDNIQLLAVYGTLRPGMGNFNRLLKDGLSDKSVDVTWVATGTTKHPYRMTGHGVPYVYKGQGRPRGSKQIVVDLFHLGDPHIAQAIDRLEGHPSHYRREIIPIKYTDITGNSHTVDAWLYFMQGSPSAHSEFYSDFVTEEEKRKDKWLRTLNNKQQIQGILH